MEGTHYRGDQSLGFLYHNNNLKFPLLLGRTQGTAIDSILVLVVD